MKMEGNDRFPLIREFELKKKIVQISETAAEGTWVMHALDNQGNIYQMSTDSRWIKLSSPLDDIEESDNE